MWFNEGLLRCCQTLNIQENKVNVVKIDSAVYVVEMKRESLFIVKTKSRILIRCPSWKRENKNMNRIESTCNFMFIIFVLNKSDADVRNNVDSMSITSPILVCDSISVLQLNLWNEI